MSFEIYSFKSSNRYFDGTISYGFTTGDDDELSYVATVTFMGESIFTKDHGLVGASRNCQASFIIDLLSIYPYLVDSKSGALDLTVTAFDQFDSKVGEVSEAISLLIRETDELLPSLEYEIRAINTFSGLNLQGVTGFELKVTSASAKAGAWIDGISARFDGVEYDVTENTALTLSPPYGYGDMRIDITAVDSRGFYATVNETVSVTPYSPPRLLAAETEEGIVCARCDEDGVESDGGSYLKIIAIAQYSAVEGNAVKISYTCKAESATAFDDYTEIAADGGALEGNLLPTVNYIVQIKAEDSVGKSTVIKRKLPTESVYMHKAGELNSLGIGGMVQKKDTVYIAPHMRVEIAGEKWISLGLKRSNTNVSDGGRAGTGCFYLVAAGGHHVYIAFNNYIRVGDVVNAESIPMELRPLRSVYSVCYGYGVDHKLIGVEVNALGEVKIIWVFNLENGMYESDGYASFVDGYIDYWIWEE